MNKFLIVLGGPTAAGKSAVSIELAKKFRTEIISADSRQIYRETCIGTAVPSPSQLAEVPHHFIQTISLNTYYNAAIFEQEVLTKLNLLFKKNDTVVMTGGTGLYINAVCNGIDDLPSVDMEIRQSLARKYQEEGIESIRKDLQILDPTSYHQIDLRNHLRILKALEVTIQTGEPYSGFLTRPKKKREFRIIRMALDMDRNQLYQRINKRVDEMIDRGLVAEATGLHHQRTCNALKTVGYKEIYQYIDEEISLDEAIDLIKRHTRKYARKQLTWFRKDNLFAWFHPDEINSMVAYCRQQMESSDM